MGAVHMWDIIMHLLYKLRQGDSVTAWLRDCVRQKCYTKLAKGVALGVVLLYFFSPFWFLGDDGFRRLVVEKKKEEQSSKPSRQKRGSPAVHLSTLTFAIFIRLLVSQVRVHQVARQQRCVALTTFFFVGVILIPSSRHYFNFLALQLFSSSALSALTTHDVVWFATGFEWPVHCAHCNVRVLWILWSQDKKKRKQRKDKKRNKITDATRLPDFQSLAFSID